MKQNLTQWENGAIATVRCLRLVTAAVLLALVCLPALARDSEHSRHYQETNLVSDIPGVAQVTDTNLTNAWGMSFSPTSPFWISDNGTGLATLYTVTNDSSGSVVVTRQGLVVMIPGDGTPTGQFNDGSGSFHGDIFIFVSEDGTISGWRPALTNMAETLVPGDTNNVYKGVTMTTTADGPLLLAANFRQGTVDAYDTNLALVAQFSDSNAPDGYAPFNVQSLGGIIFVTFAKQDEFKHDDVGGPGNGLIDVLDPNNGEFHRFATGTDAGGKLDAINSPWGLTVSPRGFGPHGDELLVGNFGSGTIMAFNERGKFLGLLQSTDKNPVMIDGLWALKFGNGAKAGDAGTLFFTAGPDGEHHGLFGSLSPVPKRHGHGHGHDNDNDNDNDNDQGNGHGHDNDND
jgi:uncharacterized protein (TIGR03118 family)